MMITSRQNPIVRRLRRLGADAAFRRELGLYAADGYKLLEDALRSGIVPETLAEAGGAGLPKLPDTQVISVTPSLMEYISPLDAPQGVFFTIKIPQPPKPEKGRWLLLDRVQDPGNAGAILRTAEAFGLEGVLLTPGCADLFSLKAVRAAMGATFRLPAGAAEFPLALPLIAADMGGDGELCFPKDCIIALGSEGQGLSEEIRRLAGRTVSIPMAGKAQSLGVAAAAAVICWEISKG
jgi:TrmH family RNA methyltransferase